MTSTPPSEPSADAQADSLLAVYLMIEPLVAERIVLDVGPRAADAPERLRNAGARQVLLADGTLPRLSAEDRSADVVVCLERLSAAPDGVGRHRLLAELRRVTRPDGFCVVRVHAGDAQGAPGSRGGKSAAFEDLLRHHFSSVDIVSETRISGVSLSVPGVDDVAVNEALSRIAGDPTHFVALCTEAARRPWSLPESLLVPVANTPAPPTGGAEVAALRAEILSLAERLRVACAERDDMRERLMTAQDEVDRREATLSALRRDLTRHLHQGSEAAGARELAVVERDLADQRAASAERALEVLAAEAQALRTDVAALERELARLRATAR